MNSISKTEKVLVIFQLLFSVAVFCILTTTLYHYIVELQKMLNDNVSHLKLVKNYHFGFVVSLLAFVSAILILKQNIYGWLLGIISWLIYTLTFPIALFNTISKNQFENFYILFGVIALLIASITFSIYLFIRIRKNHEPTLSHYKISGLILLLLLVDYWIIK